jgi:hypothetical protein
VGSGCYPVSGHACVKNPVLIAHDLVDGHRLIEERGGSIVWDSKARQPVVTEVL